MKVTVVLAVASLLAGCMSTHAPQRFHVLEVPPAAPRPEPAAVSSRTLLVLPTTANAFYDAEAIAYSSSPGLRSHYQINSWAERPSHRVGALLTQRLAESGAFRSVAGAEDGVRGSLVLATHLAEMYHDATGTPGSVRIVLTAVLSDPGRHAIVGQHRFVVSAPVPTADAAGAVRGLDSAMGQLLDQLVAWTAGAAARSGSTAAVAHAAPVSGSAPD